MRLCVSLVLLASVLCAQIVGVELLDEKTSKKYAKWLTTWEGKSMIVGQHLSGLVIDLKANLITKPGTSKVITLLVPDSGKPNLELVGADGKRTPNGKAREVQIPEAEMKPKDAMHLCYPHQSLVGLRDEYLRKQVDVEKVKTDLRACKAGTPEWFNTQRKLLTRVDTLVGWLNSTLFQEAAKALAKDYSIELGKAQSAASKTRLEIAKGVLKSSELPESLAACSKDFGRSDLKWHGRETQHLRLVSFQDLKSSQLDAACILGERIIESFRTEFVDPFITENDLDPIPEDVIDEFFFCPDDVELAAKYYENYYGRRLGEPRERTKAMMGHRTGGSNGARWLEFWRLGPGTELDGMIAHALGHNLAALAWNRGASNSADWISEGWAYWTSFEALARNNVHCVAFRLPDYGRTGVEATVSFEEEGLRATFNDLALRSGPEFTVLLRMTLVDMDAAAVAKAWSMLDWLATRRLDKMGPFLRACNSCVDKTGKSDLEKLRPMAEEIFGVPPQKDVFAEIEQEWKGFAKTDQKKEKVRKK
ncbi:MAG: hypothetical protein EXS14_06150 [Planctomycetes bacterium]|nr:hypothetical protein [Planctomycetota bacterium]